MNYLQIFVCCNIYLLWLQTDSLVRLTFRYVPFYKNQYETSAPSRFASYLWNVLLFTANPGIFFGNLRCQDSAEETVEQTEVSGGAREPGSS